MFGRVRRESEPHSSQEGIGEAHGKSSSPLTFTSWSPHQIDGKHAEHEIVERRVVILEHHLEPSLGKSVLADASRQDKEAGL